MSVSNLKEGGFRKLSVVDRGGGILHTQNSSLAEGNGFKMRVWGS